MTPLGQRVATFARKITESDLTVKKWRRVAIGGLIFVIVSTAIIVPMIFFLNKNNSAE